MGDPAPYQPEGDSVMGELIRAKRDWHTTVLGPPQRWPQSLRTALGMALSSRFPMILFWGPALCVLYNDAYIPICGDKHPHILGQTGLEAWGEVWDFIGPMFERVQRGEATWSEDQLLHVRRRGFVEEAYFTWSYSPIRDETGGVGGVFTAVTETTARVLGERRLLTLRELGERVAESNSIDGACASALATLAKNVLDVPFAAMYLLDEKEQRATLAGTHALAAGSPAAPRAIALGDDAAWPLGQVVASREAVLVERVPAALGALPSGPWPEPATSALVLPVAKPGQPTLYGVLVAGLSPRLAYDDAYESFLRLSAQHVASAIANAVAHLEERRRVEALAEIDHAKTAFFSNVSHELRTPLTLLLGPIADALASPARALAGEPLALAHRNALRLLKLVNTLLDFSRIEAGRVQASYVPTDLAGLTADLASAFRSAMERAGLAFEVDCPELPEPVFVDRDLWEKIVLNLLSNALKFTFEGKVEVTLRRRGDHVALVVRDTGIGIPEAEQPRLFERFHRVEGVEARTPEGSGIGLALVHELVRLHGGRIQAESRPGAGTAFTVTIPRGSAHLPQDRVRAEKPVASTIGASPFVEEALRWLPDAPAAADDLGLVQPGARILLADDNSDMRAYVQRILGARWSVEAVADGAAALAAAQRERPDLVVADVMMPGLDGFGLLRALRADPALKGVPILLLSARAGEEARVEGLEAGADDYLVKPFSARELVARVTTHVQIAALRRASERERERMFAVFEQAPVALSVLRGPEHVYELANPSFLAMVGRKHLVGLRYLEAHPELEGSPIVALLDRVYATGEPFATDEHRADIDRGRGVEESYWRFSLYPVRDEHGAVGRLVNVAVDVTEQVRARRLLEAAARERDELLRRAEEANRAKDDFLAMLGHELRNPLAPIVTALHLMRLRAGGVAEKERLVIERQVAHLTALVDDLLDVSRITQGKIVLKKQQVEVAEVVAKAIELASPLLEKRQHHLTLDVPGRGLPVDGDVTRLAQVISNLLTNAAKYTERGGVIAVDAERRDGEVVVRVRDNGIGIDPAMLPRVFEFFVQEPQALDRSQGGLGLGLGLVRSLVTLHGGSVSAWSEGRGRGTEFTVRLPLADRGARDAETDPTPSRSAARAAPPLPDRARILVVDDNPDAAELLGDALQAMGYALRVAHDGPAALRIAEAFAPEAALVDIGLPVMDGYELARRLREQPSSARVRLIAVTGYGQAADRRRSAAAGFSGHLVKPVQIEPLKALLEALLGN